MTVIADSGALYALYDADDANHAKVRKALETMSETIVVPVAILSELDYLLNEFLGVPAELDFLDGVLSGHFTMEAFSEDDLRRCRELIEQYHDLNLGLADAAVVATAERLNVSRILTVDERHFRAVKPRIRKGHFSLLPSDAET